MRKILFRVFAGAVLLVAGGCSDDGFPVPPASTVPKFTVLIDNNEFAPATATFTDVSIIPDRAGEVSYFWTFGDGTSSSGQLNPTHLYSTPGVYTAKLVLVTSASAEIVEYSQRLVIKDPNATGIPVFFTDGNAVFRALINEDDPVSIAVGITGLEDSYGIIVDTVNSKLYISDYDADKILVSNLDGSDLRDFRINTGGADGMAIDHTANIIYWDTDDGIRRANLTDDNVSQMEDFATGQSDDPEGVSFDPVSGYVFWNTYNGGVWRQHKDGGGLLQIVTDFDGAGDGGGGGSTLVVGSRLFYDVFIASGDVHVKSANLDGTGVATVTTNISRVVFGLGYDKVNNKIYWGDRTPQVIKRANLDGTSTETWLTGAYVQGLSIGKE